MRLFLLNPFFCISFHKYQTCMATWKLFPPISDPSSFAICTWSDPLNLLSLSNAILGSMCWRIWTGPGVISPLQVTVVLYTIVMSMPSVWSQLEEAGVVRRLGMAFIDLDASIWSKQGYILGIAFYLRNQAVYYHMRRTLSFKNRLSKIGMCFSF